LEKCVRKLINDDEYGWDDFIEETRSAEITIWGTAIDTLENTTRFAKGSETGPLTVLHIFNQPLAITKPYEGYIGNLILPKRVVENAARDSLLISFFTPREKVLKAIQQTYPGIKSKNIHVWTLAGAGRGERIGKLWEEWKKLDVHLVEEEWELPTGYRAFVESGTYAPTYLVGSWEDEHKYIHVFVVDGYAASAEAIQASSLCPILDLDASLAIFSSKFKLSYERESQIMHLDPDAPDFSTRLSAIFEKKLDDETVQVYKDNITLARSAGIPFEKNTVSVDDFLPKKKWQVMAISGFMLPDPYTGATGIKKIDDDTYRVMVRLSTGLGEKHITLTLRLKENFEESQLMFNPLLNRFLKGEDYKERAVRTSDSGRIRNELQTLCSEALEHFGINGVKVYFDKIAKDVISPKNQKKLHEILTWYKESHPIWFNWLELY
jgi:hypothetical protein